MSKAAKQPAKKSLSSFIKTSKKSVRCTTCADKQLVSICHDYLKLRNKGKVAAWQSWRWLCCEYMNKQLGLKVRYDTVMNHVRQCLGWSEVK